MVVKTIMIKKYSETRSRGHLKISNLSKVSTLSDVLKYQWDHDVSSPNKEKSLLLNSSEGLYKCAHLL